MSKPTVGVVVLAILGLGVYSFVFFSADPAPTAAFYAPTPVAPTPGEPRSWEGAMGVGTFTTANLRSGNLLTEVPLVGWSGVGPDIAMVLYHNSALVGWKANSRGTGWKLGPGWTTSYSAQLILTPATNPTSIMAVADDGTQDVYTKVGQDWQAPVGVYDLLTASGSNWKLKHKDQSYHEFNSTGLLVQIVDASGNAITVQRGTNSRLASVTDAAGRQLIFTPNAQNFLQTMLDPEDIIDEPTIDNRTFSFSYANSRLDTMSDAMSYRVVFGYESKGRITSIRDKDSDTFLYSYDANGCLDVVTDPVPIANPSGPRLTQNFDYAVPAAGQSETNYFDRRGSRWRYEYSNELLGVFTNPLGLLRRFEYDGNRNMKQYIDPLNNTWTATYDGRGNTQSLIDPLTHQRVWDYDGLNNLRQYTDGEGNTIVLQYNDPQNPTSPTEIVEPPTSVGGPNAVTTLTYYGPTTPEWNGLLKDVHDPNNVITIFEYDQWGQPSLYAEGQVPSSCGGTAGSPYVYNVPSTSDSGSRVVDSGPGTTNYDSNNNATGGRCQAWSTIPTDPWEPTGFPDFCAGLQIDGALGEFDATFTAMGQTITYQFDLNGTWHRDRTNTHDEFGLPLTTSVSTDEEGSFSRGFAYTRDLAAGTAARVGPDGVETFVQYDTANRVQSVRRGSVASPIMTANYVYYDNDRVHTVTFGNDASIEYLYDNARRLTSIKHLNAVGVVMLRQDYGYDDRDLPTSISESDATGVVASTTFEYDARGRLYYERRDGQNPYKFDYSYDLGGNRLTKVDYFNLRTTVYHYDIEDPCRYESNNNRLEYYEVIDTAPEPDALVSTTYYYYTNRGNVERVVTEIPPPTPGGIVSYSAVRMGYAHNGRALTHAIGESWRVDPELPACPMQSWEVQYVREFRYDGARQRYAVVEHDPTVYMNTLTFSPINTKWTDYDGDEVYGDFNIVSNPSAITNLRSFEPGIGLVDPWTSSDDQRTKYYHGDIIGTTRDLSNRDGMSYSPSVYSAFGERISGAAPTDGTRYGFAGAWGYQEQADFPFLHVGARYYDPSTGRFIQRDPIGIAGGLNVYQYTYSVPTILVDPEGRGVFGGVYHLVRAGIKVKNKDYWGACAHLINSAFSFGDKFMPIAMVYNVGKAMAESTPPGLPPQRPDYKKFNEDPNPAVRVKPHAPCNNCPLNPGLPCNQNSNCPNY